MLASWLAAALPGLYLLLTSTVNLVPGIWPYDAKRMLQFALLFLLFLLPALNRRIRNALDDVLAGIPRPAGLALLAVFAVGTLSALVNARSGLHLANSLSEVALLGSLVLGVTVIAACRRVAGRGFDRIAIGLLALTGLAVGVQELLGVAAAHASGVDFTFRISLLHFSWPRFYNQVQSWAVPVIAVLPLLFVSSRPARWICGLVLALHWYIILMTGARGSFVALSVALVLAVLFLPPARRTVLTWQLGGLAAGALLYGAILFSFQARISPEPARPATAPSGQVGQQADATGFYGNEDDRTSGFLAQSVGRPLLDPMGRTRMWRTAAEYARLHPLLGIGPMNYVCTSEVPLGHPHSFPLQLAAEWGIPAALTACLLFAALAWRATMTLRRTADGIGHDDAVVGGLLLCGVLAAALHACVSGVMVMPASQVAGLIVCGLLSGLLPSRSGGKRGRRSHWAYGPGLVLSAALLVLGVHELRTLSERSARLSGGEQLWPRIWQDARVCRLYVEPNGVSN